MSKLIRNILLIVMSCLLILVILYFKMVSNLENQYDSLSKDYVDDLVPKLAKNWDADLFIEKSKLASYHEKNDNKPNIINRFKKYRSRFGALKKYNGCKGSSKIHLFLKGNIFRVDASYTAEIECSKNNGTVYLLIEDDNGYWNITSFDVQLSGQKYNNN